VIDVIAVEVVLVVGAEVEVELEDCEESITFVGAHAQLLKSSPSITSASTDSAALHSSALDVLTVSVSIKFGKTGMFKCTLDDTEFVIVVISALMFSPSSIASAFSGSALFVMDVVIRLLATLVMLLLFSLLIEIELAVDKTEFTTNGKDEVDEVDDKDIAEVCKGSESFNVSIAEVQKTFSTN
jgi:hypothetical protein